MSGVVYKSTRIGPIRINRSAWGIGVSPARRDMAAATRPHGMLIRVSPGKVQYLQGSDGSLPHSDATENNANRSGSATTHEIVGASPQVLLDQISMRLAAHGYAWLVAALGFLVPLCLLCLTYYVWPPQPVIVTMLAVAALIAGVGLIVAAGTSQQEAAVRSTTLTYQLHETLVPSFAALQEAATRLARAHAAWYIATLDPVWDYKRNAGLRAIVVRRAVRLVFARDRFLKTNFEPYAITLPSWQLYFFPDLVLINIKGSYRMLTYDQLQIYKGEIRFVEDARVPLDSRVVGYTWQFVNMNGGPDLRFARNPQMPIVLYGHLALVAQPHLNFHLCISDAAAAQSFGAALQQYKQMMLTAPRPRWQDQQPPPGRRAGSQQQSPPPSGAGARSGPKQDTTPDTVRVLDPYAVLRISPGATREEVEAAFRRMAQLNHPDKLAQLDPVLREHAEERMKAINEAHDRLMRKFGNRG